jgi:hypothetical protein
MHSESEHFMCKFVVGSALLLESRNLHLLVVHILWLIGFGLYVKSRVSALQVPNIVHFRVSGRA